MRYILEIYYQGECIERREYQEAIIAPATNEKIFIEFANRHYFYEYGNWWIVREVRHLLFLAELKLQTLQLMCEPAPGTL